MSELYKTELVFSYILFYVSFKMTSDDDYSDIFSAETNDTSNNHLNDNDCNQLQLKLHILNDFVTAMTMQMCDHLNYLIILSNIVPAVRRQRGRKRNSGLSYLDMIWYE